MINKKAILSRISPKQISGASGGFLPRPLLLRLRHPNSEKNQPRFCQILSPENSFGKTESALVPPPARILGGQNTKEKMSFPFSEKIGRAQIRKARNIFSLVLPSEARQWRDGSFAIEKSSSKVYNYSTSSNFLKIKRVERFLQSKNRTGVFAKTLSAYGGSREIP